MARGVVIIQDVAMEVGEIQLQVKVLGVPDVGEAVTVPTNIALNPANTTAQWATAIREQAHQALLDHAGIDIATSVIRIPSFS